MKKLLVSCVFSSLLVSCAPWTVGIESLQPMDTNFATSYSNVPDDSIQKYSSPTIMQMFNIRRSVGDTIRISFKDSSHMRITYIDSSLSPKSNKRSLIREGEFSKKGYFEIYLRKEKKQFPPYVPFLFNRKNIDRLRIAQTKEGFLILDKYQFVGGNVLIFTKFRKKAYDRYYRRME